MATTVTYINSALSDSAKFVTLNAYTAPSGRPKPLVRFDDEICLITDTSASPTLGIVRGYMGTKAVAHELYAAAEYGSPNDFPVVSKGPTHNNPTLSNPTVYSNVQEITSTGATGTTAALITAPSSAFLNTTGATGTGINLGVPSLGESYTIKNNSSTGALNIFSVGATINGTTGTTAFVLTATGNRMAFAFCSTAGAWQIGGNT